MIELDGERELRDSVLSTQLVDDDIYNKINIFKHFYQYVSVLMS